MKNFIRIGFFAAFFSSVALQGQSILINEEWASAPSEATFYFNELTHQVAILTEVGGYTRIQHNDPGVWQSPFRVTRIPQNVTTGLLPIGIDGDSLIFCSDEPGTRHQWMAYNLITQGSNVHLRDFPENLRSLNNFGTVSSSQEGDELNWTSLRRDTSWTANSMLPKEAIWRGYSGGKWLFVSNAPNGGEANTLNFFDSDQTVTPFPYPLNRGKAIREAHWINKDSVLVVEEKGMEWSLRLYALVDQKLIKGNAERLKVGRYSLLYETWEDTIPTIALDPVDVVENAQERVLPNNAADKQRRKLGKGNFAALFKTFTDPDQAYGFLSKLVNILPGSYAADVDTGIVILGPRRTTYDEVREDSTRLAAVAPELTPSGIVGFADQLKERNETVVALYALDRMTFTPVSVQISFFNRTKDEMIFVDSARSGQLSFVYGHGDELGMTITAKGYAPKSIRINSNVDSLPTLYHQDILMDPLAPLFRGEDGIMRPQGETKAMNFQNILFDFNSAVPRKVSAPELKAMADLIQRSLPSRVQIVGHTDNVGSDAYNRGLGMRRAVAVCEALKRLGVNPDILQPMSKGETSPIMTNDSDFNRSFNRRVELGKQ